jgi:ribonuclease P protein component
MLAKKNRLRLKKEYETVFKKGQRYFSPFFNLTVCTSNTKDTRFGIVISTNISKKATERNQLKRRIRHIIRKNLALIKEGFDLSINTKIASLLLNYSGLEQELLFLFKKAGILKNKL